MQFDSQLASLNALLGFVYTLNKQSGLSDEWLRELKVRLDRASEAVDDISTVLMRQQRIEAMRIAEKIEDEDRERAQQADEVS
jgi:hypothetical protein